MSILVTIKAASLQARKERNTKKAALLSTLLGEAQMVGKNNGNRESTDGEVIAVIKKMLNNTNETIQLLVKSNAENGISELLEEAVILELLLPKQLTTEELSNVISTLVAVNNATSIKDMGKVMKALKEQYEGQYDGSEASKIIKGQLNVSV